MNYRNDIDGLRAVAVLLVVLYHCGFGNIVHGGFVGVDVFFVISGYLITKIIYAEATTGTFDIWRFYERRVRRIFPAIIVVYMLVIVASFFIMMPRETEEQARNTLSSMAFFSNIYFYFKFDYFDATSEFNALLHTWSLSVEEQFYIFFPPIIVLIHNRHPRYLKPAIIVAAIVSLALSQWQVSTDRSAAFYLVQNRAWELLAGSMLAMGFIPVTSNKYLTNIGAAAGLALIAASAWFLESTDPFPGLAALPAVLGSALIIWAGTNANTIVGWWLSLKPARFIGWISYSLYLWHWPIWVLGGQLFDQNTPLQKLAFIAAAMVAATISWWFIERPFRKSSRSVASRQVIARGLSAMVIAAAVSIASPFMSSAYWQVSPQIEKVASFINYRGDTSFRVGTCFLTSQYNELRMFDFTTCLSPSAQKRNILLMGDSHAAHFYPGLAALEDFNVMQATASGCRPVDGTTGESRCTSLVRHVEDELLPKSKVDVVIISARWRPEDADALSREVTKIRKYAARVIVFGPIAEYDRALPRVLAQSLYAEEPKIVDEHRVDGRRLDQRMRAAALAAGAEYISIQDTLCPDGKCTLWTADGNPIQSDYGHLTAMGSIEIIRRVRAKIDQI